MLSGHVDEFAPALAQGACTGRDAPHFILTEPEEDAYTVGTVLVNEGVAFALAVKRGKARAPGVAGIRIIATRSS
jgi:hypothetical protein